MEIYQSKVYDGVYTLYKLQLYYKQIHKRLFSEYVLTTNRKKFP